MAENLLVDFDTDAALAATLTTTVATPDDGKSESGLVAASGAESLSVSFRDEESSGATLADVQSFDNTLPVDTLTSDSGAGAGRQRNRRRRNTRGRQPTVDRKMLMYVYTFFFPSLPFQCFCCC